MPDNYLIIGNDSFIREKELAKIRDRFLSSSELDLNFSVHAPDDPDSLMDSLGTMPFIAENRVVAVKDMQSAPEGTVATINGYLDNPSATNVLVLIADDSFRKNKAFKELSGKLELIKAGKPDAGTVKGWIRGFFRKEGVDISPGAVDLIVELKADDTVGIRAELDKLLDFSGGERIEEEHVERLVGRNVSETIFKLVDAINAGNAEWAFRVVNDMYDQNKRPHELIGYLGTYMRKIQAVKLLSSRGADQSAIASALGTKSSYYAKRMIREAGRFSPEKISRWTAALLNADIDIKRGKKKDLLALDMLISGMCGS